MGGTAMEGAIRAGRAWQAPVEIALIGAWAAWLGRAYLDGNPYSWPVGGEWGTQLQTHQLWIQLERCGLCALWNGGINGGAPALADLFGSMLHPVVMITTLLWGVVAGAKVAVVVALAMGGIAQWWIGRVLQVGLVPRLWSALLATAGGHLAGRLENGNFGLVLSTAACSLALAAALDLGMSHRRRSTLLLAAMGASALVAGQGYMQLALLGWGPALLWFLVDKRWRLAPIWREYLLAIVLAVILAGIFLIPLLHFWPQVTKGNDRSFRASQPLAYIPLNLIITQDKLGSAGFARLPYAYLYNLYIGWLPAALALGSTVAALRSPRRDLLFLGTGTILMFVLASATLLRSLDDILPSVANVRHTPLTAGLAVPAVLGLAAAGLDRLLAARLPSGARLMQLGSRRFQWVPHPAAPAIILLLWSLWTPATNTRRLLTTMDAQPIYEAMAALRTPGRAWVAPPYGELRWTQAGLDLGLKLSPIVWVFRWRDVPMPYLEAVRPGQPAALLRLGPWAGRPLFTPAEIGIRAEQVGRLAGAPIYRYPDQHYAAVVGGRHITPCQAAGSGGDLVISCSNQQAGDLVIQEHFWDGWAARRDGEPAQLKAGTWLRLDAPAGSHTYRLRYRPWDVLLGFMSSAMGAMLMLWLWTRSARTK
jgi:hypothetical protein